MEKSIKRVEKLVHATNSALAQMKFNLMFDDVREDLVGNCQNGKNFEPTGFGDAFLDGGDLRLCQDEFKAEANEMLAKMETMFKSSDLPRKNSKAVDRIKEINEKMNNLRLEHSKPTETEESRQKLLSLLSEEKFSPRRISPGKESFRSKLPVLKKHHEKPPSDLRKSDSTTTIIVTPATAKPKEELREKILETQEIVNRGFQTARQLAEKVESMTKCDKREKTPSSEKTVSDLRSSDGKTESNETVHSVKCRRCAKEKKKKMNVEKVEVNAKVIEVKRNDFQSSKTSNLQFQRLPSLHIKGGLQLQKVHTLEIPAGGDAVCERSNTGVTFLSHEEMEKEKMKEIVEKVRKENCCCIGDDPRWNYIECFNCGKLIRIRESRADPRKVDEILQKCNYNVFDPRIDEFAEKCGAVAASTLPEKPEPLEPAPSTPKKPEEDKKVKMKEKSPKRGRRPTIQHLSNQLLRKYKEEADTIEGNHLKLDSILQNLFRKVDESREVFEDCRLLRNRKLDSGRVPVLTTTKPVLVSLEGTSFKGRKRQRKLDASKRRTDSQDIKMETERKSYFEKTHGISSVVYTLSSENAKAEETKQTETTKHSDVEKEEEGGSVSSSSSKSGSSVRGRKESIQLRIVKELDWIAKKEEAERKLFVAPSANKPAEIRQEETEREATPSSIKIAEYNPAQDKAKESERKESPTVAKEKPPSETSSDNNYESDFESMTNEPEEIGDEDEELEMNPRVEKLSTISEVDSELEKKVSDEPKTSVNGSENKPKEEISTGSKKTTPQKTETSIKSTPTELVTSLKDILTALKDQFARTESLAEKLTENAKSEKKEKPEVELPFTGDVMLNPWRMPNGTKLVKNLQSARRELSKSPKIPLGGEKSGDSLSEEGGSSLGEIVFSERKRKTSGKSENSSVSESSFLKLSSGKQGEHFTSGSILEMNSEDMLYSEGEIPSDELLAFEPSQTKSVGEALSGKNSVASLD